MQSQGEQVKPFLSGAAPAKDAHFKFSVKYQGFLSVSTVVFTVSACIDSLLLIKVMINFRSRHLCCTLSQLHSTFSQHDRLSIKISSFYFSLCSTFSIDGLLAYNTMITRRGQFEDCPSSILCALHQVQSMDCTNNPRIIAQSSNPNFALDNLRIVSIQLCA